MNDTSSECPPPVKNSPTTWREDLSLIKTLTLSVLEIASPYFRRFSLIGTPLVTALLFVAISEILDWPYLEPLLNHSNQFTDSQFAAAQAAIAVFITAGIALIGKDFLHALKSEVYRLVVIIFICVLAVCSAIALGLGFGSVSVLAVVKWAYISGGLKDHPWLFLLFQLGIWGLAWIISMVERAWCKHTRYAVILFVLLSGVLYTVYTERISEGRRSDSQDAHYLGTK